MYHFETPTEFTRWKDGMEEEDHVYYTKQKEYKPSEGMMHVPQIQSQQCVHTGDVTKRVYYVCCRDGNYRSCTKQNQTGKNVPIRKIQGNSIIFVSLEFMSTITLMVM